MSFAHSLLLIPLIAVGASSSKKDSEEVRRLQSEIDELRAEVAALRSALSEAARLDRRRAELFERLVGTTAPRRAERSPPPSKKAAPVAPALEKSAPAAPSLTSRKRRTSRKGKGTIRGRVTIPKGEPVAYVYVENIRGRMVEGRRVQIDQKGKKFLPGWAVVEKGTNVEFPNYDNIYHNVFSRSPGNMFDLGLYRSGDGPKAHRFVNSGPVDVYCNIHPNMSANVLVVPNRYFAKVGEDGRFELANVPAGRRKIVAWSPGSEPTSAWVELENGGTTSIDLSLSRRRQGHMNKFGRPYGSYP